MKARRTTQPPLARPPLPSALVLSWHVPNVHPLPQDTVVEKAIPRLFEGKSLSYIECVNVDCKSARAERFEDLQLDVKGCRDVYASFDKYVEVENLDGSNQYQAEGHGLQDARKGVWFQEFPPVLELQLRRFGFDFQRDVMFKINDRYEFPDELDLDKYLAPEVRKPGNGPLKGKNTESSLDV